MGSFTRTLSLRLPKIIAESSRRNLHHLSSAVVFCKDTDALLCPYTQSYFNSTTSARYFSEKILNSKYFLNTSETLTQNDIVYSIQDKLIAFHDMSGLPWWGVIITSTIAVRTLIIFPIATHHQYVIARLVNLSKEMDTTVKEEVTKYVAKLAKENNWDSNASDKHYHYEMKKRRYELHRKYNCNPIKCLILIFIQMPIWVTISGAIRNINSMLPVRDGVALQAYLEMKASGFSILKDLTVPDETLILAFIIVFVNLAIIQLNEMSGIHGRNTTRIFIVTLMRLFSLGTFPFIIYAPKCMLLYWLTSSTCGLVQSILFVHPKTRKMLRIPHTDTLRKDPFAHIKNRFKSIYYFFKY